MDVDMMVNRCAGVCDVRGYPPPPTLGYGVYIQEAESVNNPIFKVRKYEVSHCNQLIRDTDNNEVMTFYFFHKKFGFLPPDNLIEFKVPIRL